MDITKTKKSQIYGKKLLKGLLNSIFGLIIVLNPLFTHSLINKVAAKTPDFEQNTNYIVDYNPGDDFATITEIQITKVNNSSYYYPATDKKTGKPTTQDFSLSDHTPENITAERSFKKQYLKVWREGKETSSYKVSEQATGLLIKVEQYGDILAKEPYEVKLQYRSHELVKVIGNVYNIYIPGLVKETQFETTDKSRGTLSTISYTATLNIPDNAPAASYIRPENVRVTSSKGKISYTLSNKDLINTTIWIQLGTEQYTYFKLVQKTPKTDTVIPQSISNISDIFSTNIFKIALPREFEETDQKTFYKKITPAPTRIETDSEGNYIATFEVPANKESEIVIEGYILLETDSATSTKKTIPNIVLENYFNQLDKNILSNYLVADTYWQINNPEIKAAADTLLQNKASIYDLIYADYRFVIDNLTYSSDKIKTGNVRMGAVKALQGSPAVCMEYADLLIALLRAQGVPARPAFGYSNNPITASDNIENINDKRPVGHQWVQVWIPGQAWVSVDPTWGESNREYIGGDLSHVLWYTKAKINDPIYDVVLFSANSSQDSAQDLLELEIRQINKSEYPENTGLKIISEIAPSMIEITNLDQTNDLSFILKTTPAGKAFVIILPIVLTLVVLIFIISLIIKAVKKKRKA